MSKKNPFEVWVNKNFFNEYASERQAVREAKKLVNKHLQVGVVEWGEKKTRTIALWVNGKREV